MYYIFVGNKKKEENDKKDRIVELFKWLPPAKLRKEVRAGEWKTWMKKMTRFEDLGNEPEEIFSRLRISNFHLLAVL